MATTKPIEADKIIHEQVKFLVERKIDKNIGTRKIHVNVKIFL